MIEFILAFTLDIGEAGNKARIELLRVSCATAQTVAAFVFLMHEQKETCCSYRCGHQR